MVPALNSIGTSVACLGNHDLDFGVQQFERLAAQCKFPWLCANVLDPALGDDAPLANCRRTVMLTSTNGIKIGIIGIVEREWLDTINTLPPNLKYLSASATAAELAPKLRADGAEIVIVLSHQREPNDNKLAQKLAPGVVDIVLGGHDHYYGHSIINGTHVLRSGSDFKQLSYIEARRMRDGSSGWDFNILRRDVFSSIEEEPEAAKLVNDITQALKSKLEKPIGYTAAPLDARFTTVRLKESNLGNFVCDIMRFHYDADCAIMAAGTIRGDQIYPPGVLRVKDIMNCFPFEDPCVVIAVKGRYVLEALENAVGKYPALEGRFPQVSGIKFKFNPNETVGERCSDAYVAGKPLELNKEYKVVTRDYMVRGKDGFTSLMLEECGGPAKSIVSEENGLLLSMLLRQYFMSLKVLGKFKAWSGHLGRHWGAVHENLHSIHPVQEPAKPTDASGKEPASVHSQANGGKESSSWVDKAPRRASGPPSKRFKAEPDHTVYVDDSESEDDQIYTPLVPVNPTANERELFLMRKYMRKWWRLAGLTGHPNLCEERSDDSGVPWTKGITPRVEGRIKIVNREKINSRG